MSTMTALEVFETTVHKTNVWLNDLMGRLGSENRHQAYLALRATLHALRDRLTVEETAHLGAQLPMLVRGFYYEGWDPAGKPVKERRKEEFLARLDREMRGRYAANDGLDPERAARAVFAMLAARVTEGEIEDVKRLLPAEIRDLWA